MSRRLFIALSLLAYPGIKLCAEALADTPPSAPPLSTQNYLSTEAIETNKELYNPQLTPSQYQNALAKALGWVDDPNGPSLRCQKCGGYYDERHFPAPSNLSFTQAPTTIKAHPPMSYKINGDVHFENGVVIRQPGRLLYATQATLTPNLKTGKLDFIKADEGIRMEQPGQLLLAQSLEANLVNHQADMDRVNYLFKVGSASPSMKTSNGVEDPIFTGFAHGSARSVKQLNANQYTLKNASYSTCSPRSHTWSLEASTINIDQAEGEGQAYNTVLKIHGIPVFYLPYFNFPTNTQRKSGFLYGSMALAPNDGGLEFSLPYYFNLAPNYDDLLTPNIYTKRGVLWVDNLRFLTQSSSGNIQGQIIPSDHQYGNQTRYSYSINDTTTLNSHWSGSVNYNYVSDADYLSDFSLQNLFGVNQTLLNRSATLTYQDTHWNVQGLLQSYQIVNPSLLNVNAPYQEFPALSATAQYPNLLGPLSFNLGTSYVDFLKSPGNGSLISPVEAKRVTLNPSLSLPLTASYGYFTPTITYANSFYSLNNSFVNGFPQAHPSLDVPIFDVDTSLFFDKPLKISGNNYTQTLSPRLFYLYAPYQNQNNIPIFDTSINVFDFNQLFSTNHFSGSDRVSNANQISYALTTELNTGKGQEVLSAGIGQIFYFTNPQVSLCQTAPGQSNTSCLAAENPNYNEHFSDVAGYFNLNLSSKLSFTSSLTYNPNINIMDSQSYNLQYIPNSLDVFNVGYQSNHQNYSLLSTQQTLAGTPAPISSVVDASFVYGLTPTWAVLGSVNYSIQNNGLINAFGGIQYSSCCWAVRLVAYRYVTNSNPNTPQVLTGPTDTVYMVQFLLKGLGSISPEGSGAGGLLATIPGYNNQLGF